MRILSAAALEALLTPAVEALGYVFWGCVIESQKRPILRIFVDKPTGVTVEDCTKASHQMKGVLAVEAASLTDYVLEVSSPGMDRQLFKLSQYEQYTGKSVKLRLRMPLENQRNFQGFIEKIDGETVILRTEKGSVAVEFDNIERAHVVPEFKIEGKDDE